MKSLENQRNGLEKIFQLRLVFMENSNVYEFDYDIPDGIKIKYLKILYEDIERSMRQRKCQLLVVLPLERLRDSRIPVFITQDFDTCSAFSLEVYFSRYNLEVVKSKGRVRRVRNV